VYPLNNQGSSSSGSEKQQLLANDRLPDGEGRQSIEEAGSNPLYSGPASHQERLGSPRVKDKSGKAAKQHEVPSTKGEGAGSKGQQGGVPASSKVSPPEAALATDLSTRHSKMKQPLSPGAQLNKSKKAKLEHQQDEQGAQQQHQRAHAPAVHASQQADDTARQQQLQDLIEAELGPPKFDLPKTQIGLHTAKDSMGSLEALLDQQFGPPKFAVPKASVHQRHSKHSPKQDQQEQQKGHISGVHGAQRKTSGGGAHPHAASKASEQQPAAVEQQQQQPHLRLEVLSGPATGRILDTRDPGQEVGAAGQATASVLAGRVDSPCVMNEGRSL
jgi:hypothetical protein